MTIRFSLVLTMGALSCGAPETEEEQFAADDEATADDDGDGYTRAEEAEYGTDPNSKYSRPYAGGYNTGICDELPSATGPTGAGQNPNGVVWDAYQLGDVAENWTMTDQHGEEVDLYSFCGKHVMMVLSAGWCGPCRNLATSMQSLQDEYRDQDVQVIEVLTGDDYDELPNIGFLAEWATDYGFSDIPVLVPPKPTDWDALVFQWEVDSAIPTIWHIGPDGSILSADGGIHDPGAFLD